MSLKKIQKEYRDTSGKEISTAVLENFVYGFLGSVLVVFISERVDIMVIIGYLVYYFFLSKIVNRPKYVTSLGKFIVFPVPAALGAFTGYELAYILSEFL